MTQRNEESRAEPPTTYGGARYTLETYRDDRVEANVRRLAMERTAAGAENVAVAPDSPLAAGSPRRRAVLRETSMPSAFEYVNYNMPETVPQEVIARRQIARDMADPGIYSDGPRVTDIIHQPPRHAMLSPPVAVQRSSRNLLLSRDRAMAGDENLAPLPRPYVPRGLIDAFCEPYQYDRGRGRRATLAKQIRGEAARLRQSGRDLQENLGTATKNTNPNRMELAEVQAAANVLRASDTSLNIGRKEILATLQNLQQNWYPEELVLDATRIQRQVFKLTEYPNEEVAQLAKDLIEEWRETIRIANGRNPTIVGQDPFLDEETEEDGPTIPLQTWDNAIRDRQVAAQDYNNAASAEIRAAKQRRRREAKRQRQDQEDEDMRLHMQRLGTTIAARRPRTNASTDPSSNAAGADPKDSNDGRENGRNTDSTITDPGADLMPTGNQDFEIAEVDPSPERPQRGPGNNALQERPEDVPIQSIEVDGAAGPCHECPDFPGTYHHICIGNPQCANLRARPSRKRTSPSYGPSWSPQGPRRTTDELIQAAREGLARLRETARANSPADNINAGRSGLVDTQRVVTHPVTNPATVPEGMDDPFATSNHINSGLGIKNFSGRDLGKGTDEVSPSRGRMPRAQREGTPTVLTSPAPSASPVGNGQAESPRPTWADYAASTSAELLDELQNRRTSPISGTGIGKDGLIRMLMTQDASGNRGSGAPTGLSTGAVESGSRGSSSVSPLNIDFFKATEPAKRASQSASASSSGSGPRTGSKRPSPSSNDEPLLKRLRSNNGVRKSA